MKLDPANDHGDRAYRASPAPGAQLIILALMTADRGVDVRYAQSAADDVPELGLDVRNYDGNFVVVTLTPATSRNMKPYYADACGRRLLSGRNLA